MADSESAARILLVEDHVPTALSLCRLLSRRGYSVEVAYNCFTASQAVRGGKFDALICDIGLPDGTGWDLLRDLRTMLPNVPAIAVSGLGSAEDRQRSMAAGFCAHLTKPVTIQVLMDAVQLAVTHPVQSAREA